MEIHDKKPSLLLASLMLANTCLLMILIANSFSGHSPKPHTKFTVHSDRERDTMSHATQADMRRDTMEQGGVHDSRFAPGLARWYIPDNLPQIFTEDHEQPPLSFAEAYGHYVTGPDGLRFWDSHWIRFYYQWVYQMKTSPLRVHSPEAADFIFVPVCLGLWCGARPTYPLYFRSDAYKWTHSQYDRSTFFFKEAPKLLPWLGKKPHVVVYNGALPSSLMQRGAVNFTFVGLETVDGMDPARFLTAPYPSHEHYDIHSQLPSLDSLLRMKGKLAVGIYVVRKAISDPADTRMQLYESCMAHPDACSHVTWEMANNMSFKAAAYSNYTTHWYCLQPPGDWVLRGAFYDCVVAGGLPLVFNAKYPQLVAYSDFFNYSSMLQLAPQGADSAMDYIKFLQQLHESGDSKAKLHRLHQIKRVFQYALNPDHYLIRWQDRNKRVPGDDAFTFSMKALLRGLCNQHVWGLSKQCVAQNTKRNAM